MILISQESRLSDIINDQDEIRLKIYFTKRPLSTSVFAQLTNTLHSLSIYTRIGNQ